MLNLLFCCKKKIIDGEITYVNIEFRPSTEDARLDLSTMTVRNAGDGPDPTAMENEDGLCYSTRINGQSICPARIRQEPQKKAVSRLFFLPAMQRRPLPGMPRSAAMPMRYEIRSEYSPEVRMRMLTCILGSAIKTFQIEDLTGS